MSADIPSTTDGAEYFAARVTGTLEEISDLPRSALFRLMIRKGGACVIQMSGGPVVFTWARYIDAENAGVRRWARYQLANGCPDFGKYDGGVATPASSALSD